MTSANLGIDYALALEDVHVLAHEAAVSDPSLAPALAVVERLLCWATAEVALLPPGPADLFFPALAHPDADRPSGAIAILAHRAATDGDPSIVGGSDRLRIAVAVALDLAARHGAHLDASYGGYVH